MRGLGRNLTKFRRLLTTFEHEHEVKSYRAVHGSVLIPTIIFGFLYPSICSDGWGERNPILPGYDMAKWGLLGTTPLNTRPLVPLLH